MTVDGAHPNSNSRNVIQYFRVVVFSTMSSGICAIVMAFVVNKTQNLIVSATFSSVISCGNAALDCLITEIFPTNLR